MINKALLEKLDTKSPATWLATWFGCGFIKYAPGTIGTIGAMPFGLLILIMAGKLSLVFATVLIFLIGLWASQKFEAMSGDHDNSAIVIDEAAGIFVTLLFVPVLTPVTIILSFLLFRLFDIIKPWPVSWLDKRLQNHWGVMADDVAAGILAGLAIFVTGPLLP